MKKLFIPLLLAGSSIILFRCGLQNRSQEKSVPQDKLPTYSKIDALIAKNIYQKHKANRSYVGGSVHLRTYGVDSTYTIKYSILNEQGVEEPEDSLVVTHI